MQNIDPKERPKLIGLIAAAVVVFGIAVKVTIDSFPKEDGGGPAASNAAQTPAPPAQVAAGGAAPAPAPGAPQPSPSPEGFRVDGYSAKFGRDPFKPVPDDKLAKEAVRAQIFTPDLPAPVNNPIDKSAVLPGIAGFGPGVRDGVKRLVDNRKTLAGVMNDINNTGNPMPAPSVVVLPPPAPPYTVIGVLIGEPGDRDVAILHRNAGGDEKRFVVVGDRLEGGYTVSAIESEGIRVRHAGGGTATATTPDGNEFFLPRQTNKTTVMTLPLGASPAPTAGK